MLDNNYLGRVVYSKSGRDKDRLFLIVGVLNEQYVLISDGSLRKIEKPKKKKIKHLILTDKMSRDIGELIDSKEKVSNLKIKKFLQSEDTNKEV